MTWRKSIQTLIKNPMYLVITLLPLLLIAMLLMPLLEQFKTLLHSVVDSGLRAGYYTYYDSSDFLENEAIFNAVFSMMGKAMILSVTGLVSQLIFTPIALQYLGDATLLGSVPPGYAGRGLKRLWWKPFAFSALLNLALYFAVLPVIVGTLGTLALLLSPFGGGVVLFIFLAIFAVAFIIRAVTELFHASAAMENLPFFTSIGRAFTRTFSKNFGRILGAAVICFAITGAASLLFIFGNLGGIISKVILLEQSGSQSSPKEVLAIPDEWLNQFSTSMLAGMIFAWLTQSFFTSYCFQLTAESIGAPAASFSGQGQAADPSLADSSIVHQEEPSCPAEEPESPSEDQSDQEDAPQTPATPQAPRPSSTKEPESPPDRTQVRQLWKLRGFGV